MGFWGVIKSTYRVTKGAAKLTKQGIGAAASGLERVSDSLEAYNNKHEKEKPIRSARNKARSNASSLRLAKRQADKYWSDASHAVDKALEYVDALEDFCETILDDEALADFALTNRPIMDALNYSNTIEWPAPEHNIENAVREDDLSIESLENDDEFKRILSLSSDVRSEKMNEYIDQKSDSIKAQIKANRVLVIKQYLNFVPIEFDLDQVEGRAAFCRHLDELTSQLNTFKSILKTK